MDVGVEVTADPGDGWFHISAHGGLPEFLEEGAFAFVLDTPMGSAEVRVPGLAETIVENALAAWAVCAQFGLKISDFALAMQSLSSVSMRA